MAPPLLWINYGFHNQPQDAIAMFSFFIKEFYALPCVQNSVCESRLHNQLWG